MKAYVLIFLLLPSLCFSEGIFTSAEVSYLPLNAEAYEAPQGVYFETDVAVGYEYKGLYIRAEQTTGMVKGKLHMFRPYIQDYKLEIGYTYDILYVKYTHLCGHGISPTITNYGHDKITIGFDTRLNNGSRRVQ